MASERVGFENNDTQNVYIVDNEEQELMNELTLEDNP